MRKKLVYVLWKGHPIVLPCCGVLRVEDGQKVVNEEEVRNVGAIVAEKTARELIASFVHSKWGWYGVGTSRIQQKPRLKYTPWHVMLRHGSVQVGSFLDYDTLW